MKKQKIIPLISLFFLGLFFVFNDVSADIIKDFHSEIKINSDSSVLIQEKIIYDFEGIEKHGIYRTIPLKNYKNKKTKIEVISVVDENSNQFNFTKSVSGGELTIKIGDADKLIGGVKEYNISYLVSNAVGYFDDFDEIYWNVTGNEWQSIIEKVSASVILPDGINPINKSCYFGGKGATNKCNISELNVFSLNSILREGEGLTIALSFPKGIVKEPSKIEKIISLMVDNVILVLPILVFIVMFLIWRKRGKDPKEPSVVVAQYEPPVGVKPSLVGALVKERVEFKDITAGVIYLAEQGFIKIKKLDKKWFLSKDDYEIELIKNDISSLEKIEKRILELLFSESLNNKIVKISDFKNDISFRHKVNSIINDIYQEMTDKGFYEKNPNSIRAVYIVIPLLVVGLLHGMLSMFLSPRLLIISAIISGIVIFIFGLLMNKKTKLGTETRNYILGFKVFLSITEKDRLRFHNAPEKNPEKFMEFLPYAIALGVERKWGKQFEEMYIEKPSWYSSSVAGTFVAMDFVSGFSQSFYSTIGTGQSGSSGGGFSGGGGGGGGGGSW